MKVICAYSAQGDLSYEPWMDRQSFLEAEIIESKVDDATSNLFMKNFYYSNLPGIIPCLFLLRLNLDLSMRYFVKIFTR
jgi:hypothetical protein